MFDLKAKHVLGIRPRDGARAGGGLFTPCTVSDSLLEAVTEAAKHAAAGDVILLSLACSSFDQFQNHQQCAEQFCRPVKSISGGRHDANPYMNGRNTGNVKNSNYSRRTFAFSFHGFLRENRGANNLKTYLTERTPQRQIQ